MLGKPLVRFREGRGGNWSLSPGAPRLLDPAVRPRGNGLAMLSAEGAALWAFQVPRLRRSISPIFLSRPDGRAYSLTALRACSALNTSVRELMSSSI